MPSDDEETDEGVMAAAEAAVIGDERATPLEGIEFLHPRKIGVSWPDDWRKIGCAEGCFNEGVAITKLMAAAVTANLLVGGLLWCLACSVL